MSVHDEEDRTHAELEMIEHSLSVVGGVEENQSDEETTAEMMEELNPQNEFVASYLQKHHLEKHEKLLEARQRVLAFEDLRQLFHLLQQRSLVRPRGLRHHRRRSLQKKTLRILRVGRHHWDALLLAVVELL